MNSSYLPMNNYGASYNDHYPMEKCQVKLKNKQLWDSFHKHDNEMVVTKSGRRMFPAIHVTFEELDPNASYCVFLEVTLATSCRYRYSSSVGWSPAGNEEAQSPHRLYMHPESPQKGQHWMSQFVSFGRVKLTNSCSPPSGHIVLSSMHKYQPRILIVQTSDPQTMAWAPTKCMTFSETQFMAVTAYQNEKITKLKIDHNPFAKGFRESGKSTSKRRISGEKHEEPEVKKTKVENKEEVIKPTVGFALTPTSYYGYYDYYPHYNVYTPVWTGYYNCPTIWGNHHIGGATKEEIKPKKLTDFSIRAITGIP